MLNISFTTSGTFAADNSFRVQLSSNFGGTYVDLPGSFTSSPASVTLPFPSTPESNYVYRVMATKPLIVSPASYSFKIAIPPTARLLGSSTGAVSVNPYTTVNLSIVLTGGGSYTMTLQDSTRLIQPNNYFGAVDYPVNPAKTTTYSVASVRNACGTGTASGSATVQVNSVGFQLVARGNENLCLGAQLPVYFSSTAPLPPTATFEAELISTNESNRSIALPVTGNTSPLQVTLPKQYIGTFSYGYQLRIFSKNAGISAYYRDGSTFNLESAPRLSLSVDPAAIDFGGQASLILSYTGTGSGNVVLSDGRRMGFDGFYSPFGTNATTVSPSTTTSYSIVSYTGTCYEGVSYGTRQATVEVRPGLRIDSLSTREICTGQSVTMYYTATPGYTLPSRLRVRYGFGYVTEATVVKPGQLTFTPVTSLPFQNQAIQLVNATVDTVLTQTNLPLTIKTKPIFSFARDQQSVSTAGDVSLEASYFGGGTTQLLLNTGVRIGLTGGYLQTSSSQTFLPVYVTGTTTFSVVSVSNECGVGPLTTTRPAITVTVQNPSTLPTSLVIRPVDSTPYNNFCPGSRQGLNVYKTGTFNADNQFLLEVSGPNGNFTGASVQSFSTAESISFTLPTLSGTYRVRVSSTSPVSRSNEQTFFVSYSPSVGVLLSERIPDGSAGSLTIAAGQRITASYNFTGGRPPYDYELANGVKGRTDYSFQTTYQPTTTGNFGLVRVTDACGTTATGTSLAPRVVVVPSLTKTEAVYPLRACIQSPLLVPYVQFGSVPASASYVVQFSEDLQTWETASTSGTTSPLSVTVPASFVNKQVFYRVAYLANGTLVAGTPYTDKLPIQTTPTVLLTTPTGATTVQVTRGNFSTVDVSLIGMTLDATVILASGSAVVTARGSVSGNTYRLSQPGTYSIVSAVNSCGYGQASGLVKVTERPSLTVLQTNRTSACVGQTISFTYAAAGDYNPGNKIQIYLIDNYTGSSSKVLLGETTALSGVYTFTLSSTLKPSSYSVQLEASAPATVLSGFTFPVNAPVSATLLQSGTGIAYENDMQYLRVFSTSIGPYSLTVSSPAGQSVINASNSIYDFPVTMTRSGSYSIVSVANQCGAGQATGLYSVSVIPAASVTIRPSLAGGPFCTGKTFQVYLSTTGVFSTTNTFMAYLTDSTGATLRTLPTVSSASQLTVTIPTGTPDSDRYILRVGSSSPQHLGASVSQNVSVRQTPTGTLTGNTSIFKGDSTRISVDLTGTPPWRFVLTDFFGPRVFTTSTTPYALTVRPDTTVGFRLTEVSNNQCGLGTATGTALITVTKLLATEPVLPLQLRTYPNPTAGWIQLDGDVPGRGDVLIGIYNAAGTLVHQSVGAVRQGRVSHRIDLSNVPTGIYILTAEQEGRRSQFKLIKH